MSAFVNTGGELKEIISGKTVVDGIERQLVSMKVMTASGLKTVATFTSPLTVSTKPDNAFGFVVSNSASAVQTSAITAIVDGGLAPYNYTWSIVSFTGPVAPSILTPNNASASFLQPVVQADSSLSAIVRVSVVDSFGSTAIADATASFEVGSFN